jgi:hypothetical protein
MRIIAFIEPACADTADRQPEVIDLPVPGTCLRAETHRQAADKEDPVMGDEGSETTYRMFPFLWTEVGPGRAVDCAGHHGEAPHHRGIRVQDPGCCQPLLSPASTIGRFSLRPARPP